MTHVLEATFDGVAFQPDKQPALEPNTKVRITVEPIETPKRTGDAWSVLESMIGIYDGPADWSAEHDHYLYGAPKSASKLHE